MPDSADFDVFLDCLQHLDTPAKGKFLQRLFRVLANLDLTEEQSVAHWNAVLSRRAEMSAQAASRATLRAAALDYLCAKGLMVNPVFLEGPELERLRLEAATDTLTGLHNRRFFDHTCVKELASARRYRHSLTLLLMDLRNFKAINDTFGHPVGDDVLRRVGRAIADCIRESDYGFRTGGDEFAILLTRATDETAQRLAQRIVTRLNETMEVATADAGIQLDWGAACYPDHADSAAGLYAVADSVLYTAKREAKLRRRQRPPRSHVPRRHDRISLQDSGAVIILKTGTAVLEADLVDLSPGGVGFCLTSGTEIPERFWGRLQLQKTVPPFRVPSDDLEIDRTYVVPMPSGLTRVGGKFRADLA
jgi:diguanylate cyclase (GGDEF)-like protein